METRSGRQAWMLQRVNEDREANAPDDSSREYDLDVRADRIDYLTARLQGEQFEDAPASEEAG